MGAASAAFVVMRSLRPWCAKEMKKGPFLWPSPPKNKSESEREEATNKCLHNNSLGISTTICCWLYINQSVYSKRILLAMVTQLFSKCWNIDVSLSLAICQPLHVYFPMSWIMLSTETGIPWIPWFFVNTTLTLILFSTKELLRAEIWEWPSRQELDLHISIPSSSCWSHFSATLQRLAVKNKF